jgi:hypothetical protein
MNWRLSRDEKALTRICVLMSTNRRYSDSHMTFSRNMSRYGCLTMLSNRHFRVKGSKMGPKSIFQKLLGRLRVVRTFSGSSACVPDRLTGGASVGKIVRIGCILIPSLCFTSSLCFYMRLSVNKKCKLPQKWKIVYSGSTFLGHSNRKSRRFTSGKGFRKKSFSKLSKAWLNSGYGVNSVSGVLSVMKDLLLG